MRTPVALFLTESSVSIDRFKPESITFSRQVSEFNVSLMEMKTYECCEGQSALCTIHICM